MSGFLQRLKEKWEQSKPAEKIMVLGLIALIVLFILTMTGMVMMRSVIKKQAEVSEYRQAIEYIEKHQSAFLADRAKAEEIRQQLISADSKIASSLTSKASALGFDVSVNPKEPHKLKDNEGVEELEIEIAIQSVEYEKLMEYFIEINKIDSPIFIRRLTLRRTGSASGAETNMNVTMNLVSYRLKEGEQ